MRANERWIEDFSLKLIFIWSIYTIQISGCQVLCNWNEKFLFFVAESLFDLLSIENIFIVYNGNMWNGLSKSNNVYKLAIAEPRKQNKNNGRKNVNKYGKTGWKNE